MLKNILRQISAVLDGILFILASNNDIHESLDVFEIINIARFDHRPQS